MQRQGWQRGPAPYPSSQSCWWQPPHRWGPNPALWVWLGSHIPLVCPPRTGHHLLPSLCSWLWLSCSSAGPGTASAMDEQPCDSATGLTTASVLPLNVRLEPRMLWSCCKQQEPQKSWAWAVWQAAVLLLAEPPFPHSRNREKSLCFRGEMHIIHLGYLEPIWQKDLLRFLFPTCQDARQFVKSHFREQQCCHNSIPCAIRKGN